MEEKIEAPAAETPAIGVITINGRGQIIGDTSSIPTGVLEQLQTPEGQARLRAEYHKEYGSGRRELRKRIQRAPEAVQRDYRHLCPPGMSTREFRKVRRQYMREQTKAAVKEMKRGAN